MIKMLIMDCDGVLTDGGMYYTEKGDEFKKFNTRDGMGIELLHKHGILTGIVTGENCELVRRRSKKMQITELKMGSREKLKDVMEICEKYRISMNEIAYIGDDINDLEVMKHAGLSFAPADAAKIIKETASCLCEKKGGEGVVREVAEKIIGRQEWTC